MSTCMVRVRDGQYLAMVSEISLMRMENVNCYFKVPVQLAHSRLVQWLHISFIEEVASFCPSFTLPFPCPLLLPSRQYLLSTLSYFLVLKALQVLFHLGTHRDASCIPGPSCAFSGCVANFKSSRTVGSWSCIPCKRGSAGFCPRHLQSFSTTHLSKYNPPKHFPLIFFPDHHLSVTSWELSANKSPKKPTLDRYWNEWCGRASLICWECRVYHDNQALTKNTARASVSLSASQRIHHQVWT